MKELFHSPVELGATICLDDSFIARFLENFSKFEKFPLQFEVKRKSNHGYFCKSVRYDSKNKITIYVSNTAMNYICGTTVQNSNETVRFCEFFPNENEKIFLFNTEENLIIPARFILRICEIDNIYYFYFILVNLMNEEYITLDFNSYSWKSIFISDEYLNDTEKMCKDTIIHKEYLIDVCNKFAMDLKDRGFYHEAYRLIRRAIVHDNSKITNHDEFQALTSIVSDKSCLENASVPLSTLKQNSIKLHWKNNSHHPEHFENYEDMSKLDRMEMVCDWMARSLQYKTDLLEFVKIRQEDRFHFPEAMFEEVYNYCKILVSLYQN